MYNAKYPNEDELPSTKQLLVSSLIALVVAGVLLLTVVLPAEYGIDPTGLGQSLGLTKMGEIKTQLAKEADQDAANQVSSEEESSDQTDTATVVNDVPTETIVAKSETAEVTLMPGEAAEIKMAMNKGDIVSYSWSVNTGHVNFDVHGDKPGTKYYNYSKGKTVTDDQGQLTAAFDGKHGWFWRNRSQEDVTITLEVSGEFSSIHRVL